MYLHRRTQNDEVKSEKNTAFIYHLPLSSWSNQYMPKYFGQ